MNLSPSAKAKIHQDLAQRLKALGGDVGEPDTYTHDERSGLRLLTAMIGLLERQARK